MGAKFREVFHSITVDNGCEFQDCEGMERSKRARKPRTKIFYCHPYSAYERGSNENMNRIIRRFFPKGTNFDNRCPWAFPAWSFFRVQLVRPPRSCIRRSIRAILS